MIAFDEEPPASPHEVFARIAALTTADAAALNAAFNLRDPHAHPEDIVRTYEKYLNALSVILSALDKIVPKREWQRAGKAGS